jgi:haloacetate dehalogenase
MSFFPSFSQGFWKTQEGDVFCRYGGDGPPVLLLHGHPRTHATWEHVAPLLAQNHTVVCPDLPGFGQSYIPADSPKSAGSSKRAKAAACVDLMQQLGFDRFSVVGHDRGAYTAFRLALDHPDRVTSLAILDAVPIIDALERCDARFAEDWWHWFFFAQRDKPERAIMADPDAWYDPPASNLVSAEALASFHRAIHDESVVHGMIEDYRAGLRIDRYHDAEGRAAGHQVNCPTFVLWSERDDMGRLYGNPRRIWEPWIAGGLRTGSISSGHHVAEEAPHDLATALSGFLTDAVRGRTMSRS